MKCSTDLFNDQLIVKALARHQFIVFTTLHDLPVDDTQDVVGVTNGGESVSDHNCCPAFSSLYVKHVYLSLTYALGATDYMDMYMYFYSLRLMYLQTSHHETLAFHGTNNSNRGSVFMGQNFRQ